MSDEISHKRVLLDLLRRRLHEREIQEVYAGPMVDPSIKIEIDDLRQRIQSLHADISVLEKSTNVVQDMAALEETPQHVAQELLELLDITGTTMRAQTRIRDKLVSMLYNRLKIQQVYEYEELLSRYYDLMTPEERHFHASMRSYTSNILAINNRQALELIQKHANLVKLLPSLKKLHQHLTLWIAKYEGLFQSSPHMAFVYVGVEEGMPFPRDAEQDLRDFLAHSDTRHEP